MNQTKINLKFVVLVFLGMVVAFFMLRALQYYFGLSDNAATYSFGPIAE